MTSTNWLIAFVGENNPKWGGRDINYRSRHDRVRGARGKASRRSCADCGKPAAEWAHVHDTDPFDVSNYQAMCSGCHRKYDTETAARGSKHGMSKLTEEKVRSIRARYATGELQVNLAAEFGMTQGTIGKIVRREIWKGVTPLCLCRASQFLLTTR